MSFWRSSTCASFYVLDLSSAKYPVICSISIGNPSVNWWYVNQWYVNQSFSINQWVICQTDRNLSITENFLSINNLPIAYWLINESTYAVTGGGSSAATSGRSTLCRPTRRPFTREAIQISAQIWLRVIKPGKFSYSCTTIRFLYGRQCFGSISTESGSGSSYSRSWSCPLPTILNTVSYPDADPYQDLLWWK